VSLSQIEYFVAVAEEGHVGRAASKLRIAQPAVSRQIRRLEDELGTALFARTSRGMKLSGAGEVFLEHALAILQGVRAARNAVRAEQYRRDSSDDRKVGRPDERVGPLCKLDGFAQPSRRLGRPMHR
jgi:DNA-binding transcriptional LysR family regulator